MACYTPLYGWQYADGGKLHNICNCDETVITAHHNDIGRCIQIPCGKCIGCRLAKSNDWATRCSLEANQWDNNWFLTLTYDDEHLPYQNNSDIDDNGVIIKDNILVPTLIKDHLKKFFKDLREEYRTKHNHTKIRFFACGEYGSTTGRPHYHIIMFNLPIFDLTLHKKSSTGAHYHSNALDNTWGNGWITINECNYNTAGYVARYVTKMTRKDSKIYKYRAPEFLNMSRNPGIGFDHFKKKEFEIYENDYVIITNNKGISRKTNVPKYYDRLSKDWISLIKQKRLIKAETGLANKLLKCNYNKEEILENKKIYQEKKIEMLIRNME